MRKRILFGILLLITLSVTTAIRPSSAVDTLAPSDFKLSSFSKTVDFFDFARAYAAAAGKPVPPTNWHAYLYQNYINVSNFQIFYSGLINITAGQGALTIPVQNFLEHYRTPEGKDVLMSSSFIMLLAFNDTATSRYKDEPDANDNLYASFSLGLDLANITGNTNKPALTSKTEITPLTKLDENTWTWGMKYTNLTAVWWRMFINPSNPHFEALPIAITTYEELTFSYKLFLNQTDHTATVTTNYVIGRMTNLWLIFWLFFIPIVAHYNATGTYRPNGTKISDENIYQFLYKQHIKMSIVLFQNSLALNEVTKSTFNNQNVTDTELGVSNGAITTEANGETIFKTDFGVKEKYKLYNYTADNTATEYDALTRIAPRPGFANNPLFSMHVAFLRYLPLIVKHVDPSLFDRAKDRILNMTYADYFYIISYPEYSGFEVEHDPTYTAYIASPTAGITLNLGQVFGIILVGVIIAIVIIVAALIFKKRSSRAQLPESQISIPRTSAISTT